MKRKTSRMILIIICAAAVLWGAVFITDFTRCNSLREPLFVIAKGVAADDGGSGTYQGLGYTVDIEKYIDPEFGSCVKSVEMKMFGKVISASITDTATNNSQGTDIASDMEPGIPYAAATWANWPDDPKITGLALNKDSFSTDTAHHVPVYKCDTLADLNEFKATFSESLDLLGSYDEVPSFEETVSTFGENFFAENSMILVYVEASSGSLRFDVENYSVDGDTFCAYIHQTNRPENVTDNMAGWLMVIPVGKEIIQNCTQFDAVLK